MTLSETDGLEKLGSETEYQYDGADKRLLERFPNPLKKGPGIGSIEISSPEFTSLCPLTGQPDFATIFVDYVPKDWCVESKSWKMYLGSYRNVGEFHESCVRKIANDLIELLDPHVLQVRGEFTPRGGIPFWPQVDYRRPDIAFDFQTIPTTLEDRNMFFIGEGVYEKVEVTDATEGLLMCKGSMFGTATIAECEAGVFDEMARKYATSNYMFKDRTRLAKHLQETFGFEVDEETIVTVVWFKDVVYFNGGKVPEDVTVLGE